MRKFFIQKAFFLFTLLFISIAAFSFAVFNETDEVCEKAKQCCRSAAPGGNEGEMLWDVVSRQFITLISFR